MLKKLLRMTALSLLVSISIGRLSGAVPATAQEADKLKVVVTFSILGDVVQNVTGEAVDLTVIVGADGDAHTFEPKPDQIAALADADLIIENGVGFEPWLDDMYEASGSSATPVVGTNGIEFLEFQEPGAEHAEEATPDGDHEVGEANGHGNFDPHVWWDVTNVISEVAVIRDALTRADPANTDLYTANATAYTAQLEELNATIKAQIETIPAAERILVTSHDALGYFAHGYGFTIAGTALGSLSTEVADPSAGEIADLIEQIKATGVKAIFAENIENSDLMEQIAENADVVLAPTLYTDALGGPDSPASTYIAMMTYDVTTIVSALTGNGS